MANKFQKSITERANRPANTSAMDKLLEELDQAAIDLHVDQLFSDPNVINPIENNALLNTYTINTEIIDTISTKKRKAHNRSFYLDDQVCQEIREQARRGHVTESKLVNEILRRALAL